MASDLKALRLQAQRTEADLAKLREQVSGGSSVDVLRGLGTADAASLVGLGLVVLALVWWVRSKRRVRGSGAGMVPTGKRGSSPLAAAPQPVATRPSGSLPMPLAETAVAMDRAPIDANRARRPASQPVVQDSAFRPSSLDVTFVEHDALSSSMMSGLPSRRDQLFAAPELALEFDPEPLPRTVDVDVLIDLPDPEVGPLPFASPIDPAGEAPEPEREIDVSVSLIQELRGLGLWSEARELAKEVVSSAHAPLDPDIATSLHKVQHGEPASGAERRKKTRD